MCRGHIKFIFVFLTVIDVFGFYTKVIAELLKLTMSAAYAGETFSVVVGENKLQCLFTRFQYLWSVGEYLHAFVDRIYTGGNKASGTFDFYNADTAGANFIDFF